MVLQVPTILKRLAREAGDVTVPVVRRMIRDAVISPDQVTGLATVATTGSYNDLADLPAVNAGTATLDFGNYGEDAVVEVTGQTGILVGASVIATVAAVDTPENLADEVVLDPPMIVAGAVVAGVGFSIYGRALEGGLHGRINVNWHWR